ncbi:MAG: response regulator transcription factor [Clostridia bacterium]|nr:response regulator transcription factor [Clostridia bacterium]
MIKLVVCDNYEYLEGDYKNYLEEQGDFDIVGESASSIECFEIVKKTRPDVLIMEVRLKTGNITSEMLDKIKNASPDTKIIIFTEYEDKEFIYNSFSCGISDYINKSSASMETLFDTVRRIYDGEDVNINGKYAKIIIDECEEVKKRQNSLLYVITLLSKLSSSEIDILKDLYLGKTYSDIAKKRSTEELTVRSQVSKILKKFNTKKMKTLLEDLRKIDALAIFDSINIKK